MPKTGKAEMVLPVHAARHSRLGRRGDAGAGGRQLAGQPRKLLIQANRNGFFYVLDRSDGELLLAKPFIKKLNWAKEIGKDGRPVLNQLAGSALMGRACVVPEFRGHQLVLDFVNPGTGLYYFQALERCNYYSKRAIEWEAGKGFMGVWSGRPRTSRS